MASMAYQARIRIGMLGVLLAGALGAGVPLMGAAADYPTKTVRLVVAFPAGGASDVAARVIAAGLSKRLSQTVFVDNISGASGNIGTERVARAAPDGHTLLFATLSTGINPGLFTSLPFNVLRDFAPISLISTSPYVLLVNAQSDIRSVADLVREAKASPGRLQYASAGPGSGAHLFMELFSNQAGIKMTHVPYRGAAPAMNDVLSGLVPLTFDSIMTAMPHVQAGKLRALAVSTARRSSIAPNVSTLDELGVRGYEATAWFGIFATAGTPKAVIDQLNAEIGEVLRQPETKTRLADLGSDPLHSTPEELQNYLRSEVSKWSTVIKSAGVTAN